MKKLIFTVIASFLILSSVIISSETIYKYNTTNGKYHRSTCKWAIKCTVNCVDMSLKKICEKQGIPCKVCKPPRCK